MADELAHRAEYERLPSKWWPGPNAYSIRCKCGTVWFPPITRMVDECPHCGYSWVDLPTRSLALGEDGGE